MKSQESILSNAALNAARLKGERLRVRVVRQIVSLHEMQIRRVISFNAPAHT